MDWKLHLSDLFNIIWNNLEEKNLYSAWFGNCLKLCHPPSWSTEQIVGLSYFTYFMAFHTTYPCSTPHHSLNRLLTEGGSARGAKNDLHVWGHFIISKLHYIRSRENWQRRIIENPETGTVIQTSVIQLYYLYP